MEYPFLTDSGILKVEYTQTDRATLIFASMAGAEHFTRLLNFFIKLGGKKKKNFFALSG